VQKRLINLGKLVSHMDKIYGDFHQAVSIPKVTKRIVNWNGAHRPCIKV
jgi:hypothetical protein